LLENRFHHGGHVHFIPSLQAALTLGWAPSLELEKVESNGIGVILGIFYGSLSLKKIVGRLSLGLGEKWGFFFPNED
jgi:hypothetical protein